jgi:hypothetical protein
VFGAVVLVLTVLLAVLLVLVVVRAIIRARSGIATRPGQAAMPPEPVVPAAEGLPADARAHAASLAAQGRYRDAVRALFGGAARRLVEAGLVRQARTRTNGELLSEVRAVLTQAHVPLSALSSTFEGAWYGHLDPGADGYAEALLAFDRFAGVVDESDTGDAS